MSTDAVTGSCLCGSIKSTENMLVPAGALDGDPGIRPENSIFRKSKAAWYVSPQELPKFDEYS